MQRIKIAHVHAYEMKTELHYAHVEQFLLRDTSGACENIARAISTGSFGH